MKIVFLNDLIFAYATGSPSAVGGAERQQWLLARALAAAEWKVTVGIRQQLACGQRVSVEGVEFVGLSQRQFLYAWYRFLLSERPDWWYWRCASHLLGLAVLLAKFARVRMIFAVGFDTDVDFRHALFQRPRLWPLYAGGLAGADRIFVQNDKQLLNIPRVWRTKTLKVPSITPKVQAVIPHRERARSVAWVAMLRRFKRPDLLIEIARKAPDIRFVVCGGTTTFTAEPGYGDGIVRTLRSLPNVDYRSQVSSDEALQIIARASLFLSTSDEEGFPNTFLQAWSAGTPVVSLSIDPDNVIERHGLGKVSVNIDQTTRIIADLIRSPDYREEIATRATQYVAMNHSSSVVVKIFESAIAGLVPRIAMETDRATPT